MIINSLKEWKQKRSGLESESWTNAVASRKFMSETIDKGSDNFAVAESMHSRLQAFGRLQSQYC